MKRLALLILLATTTAFADDLAQLKQSFQPQLQSTQAAFQRAASMQPMQIPLGQPLSKSDCESLATLITAEYKINPFHFEFENGLSENTMCGGRAGFRQNFFQSVNGTSNLGLPFVKAVQLEGDDNSRFHSSIITFLIDARNQIVEIQGLESSPGAAGLVSFRILAIDLTGAVYTRIYDKDYAIVGGGARDVRGEHHMERFLPSDGSVASPLTHNLIHNAADPSKDYEVYWLNRADQKDWDDYVLPITFADFGGYYVYAGKYYSSAAKPTHRSSVTIKLRGGREICAYGSVVHDNLWTTAPADTTAYDTCGNY